MMYDGEVGQMYCMYVASDANNDPPPPPPPSSLLLMGKDVLP